MVIYSQQQFPKFKFDLNRPDLAFSFVENFYYVYAVQLFPSLLYMMD